MESADVREEQDRQEEEDEEFMVTGDKFPDNGSVSIDNYIFVALKTDLSNHHLIMHPGWMYILQKSSVTFTYIHQSKLIATFDRRVTLHVDVRFRTRADVLEYLDGLAKFKCCEGTGIQNSYSKDCRGFILHADEYKRSRGYQRCNSCREFRKTTLLRK